MGGLVMTKEEKQHEFKNGSCLNCGVLEEFAEGDPCEEENTEWIFEQMRGTRGQE
jgi:hypothetical protein